MSSYLRDWYSFLKPTVDIDYLDLNSSNSNRYDDSEDSLEALEDSSELVAEEPEIQQPQSQNEATEEILSNSPISNVMRKLNLFLISTSSFVTLSCFLFGLVIRYLTTGSPLSGLLFLISTIIVLTSQIYYFPYFKLNVNGYIHLRVLKWILFILCTAIFLFLIRNRKNFIYSS